VDVKVKDSRATFYDQSRFRSAEVTRAFGSVIQAVALAPQSEVSKPAEVPLDSDSAISVRGADEAITRD
jgi:hypothetical protein